MGFLVEFKEWVNKVGGVDRAALALGVKPRTVASWLYDLRAPSFTAAMNIVIKTHGLVDYNGIYRPILALRKNKQAADQQAAEKC